MSKLTATEEKAITELFMRGVKVLGMPEEVTPESLIPILQAGLEDQRKFIDEMIDARTDRAKKARQVLTAQIYVDAQSRGIAADLVRQWEDQDRHEGIERARNYIMDRYGINAA